MRKEFVNYQFKSLKTISPRLIETIILTLFEVDGIMDNVKLYQYMIIKIKVVYSNDKELLLVENVMVKYWHNWNDYYNHVFNSIDFDDLKRFKIKEIKFEYSIYNEKNIEDYES